MYLAHWGLAESPFAGPRRLFYEGESHAEALARLRFMVRHSRRASLLAGRRGVGKTSVLGQFAAQCRENGKPVATVSLGGLTPRELLWQIAAQWSLGPLPQDDALRLHRRLADFAAAAPWRGATAVLLLDDADRAGPDVQTQLVRLLALGCSGPEWLTLAIAAAPSVMQLADGLLDAIDLRIDLEPWTESETVGYVQHALVEAGCERPVFDDEALSALFHLTDGVPRQVNRLADQALLGAAADGLDSVDAGMVELAHESLSWTAPA